MMTTGCKAVLVSVLLPVKVTMLLLRPMDILVISVLLRLMNKLVGNLFRNPLHADTGYTVSAADPYHQLLASAHFNSM